MYEEPEEVYDRHPRPVRWWRWRPIRSKNFPSFCKSNALVQTSKCLCKLVSTGVTPVGLLTRCSLISIDFSFFKKKTKSFECYLVENTSLNGADSSTWKMDQPNRRRQPLGSKLRFHRPTINLLPSAINLFPEMNFHIRDKTPTTWLLSIRKRFVEFTVLRSLT